MSMMQTPQALQSINQSGSGRPAKVISLCLLQKIFLYTKNISINQSINPNSQSAMRGPRASLSKRQNQRENIYEREPTTSLTDTPVENAYGWPDLKTYDLMNDL